MHRYRTLGFWALASILLPTAAFAAPTVVAQSTINAADTAWMMTSTALVLLMTLPGIALFYGLAISLVFKPELKVFWSAFLVAGLLCLVLETVWAMNMTRRLVGSGLKPVAAS